MIGLTGLTVFVVGIYRKHALYLLLLTQSTVATKDQKRSDHPSEQKTFGFSSLFHLQNVNSSCYNEERGFYVFDTLST